MMRVVVCGSRDWTDRETIGRTLAALPMGSEIAHGANGLRCTRTRRALRGADLIAGDEARHIGLSVREFPAAWRDLGNAAGPIRNREMLDRFRPHRVLAFTDSILRAGRLTGTGDCIQAAIERGIEVAIIPSARSGR